MKMISYLIASFVMLRVDYFALLITVDHNTGKFRHMTCYTDPRLIIQAMKISGTEEKMFALFDVIDTYKLKGYNAVP